MRRKKESENYLGRGDQAPDCCTCILRKTCERAAENSFCTKWTSREAAERKPDPNEQWMRGEEAEF